MAPRLFWDKGRPAANVCESGKDFEMEFSNKVLVSGCMFDWKLRDLLRNEEGQGTTEYAILVGVLVVIAIVAIVAFRGKVSELWSAISDGINSL